VALAADTRVIDAVKAQNVAGLRVALRDKAAVSATAPDQSTPLHWAAYLDDTAAAQLLVGAGANANATNVHGVSPLFLACTNASPKMVRLLLDAGADPNYANGDGETALMTASRTGNTDDVGSRRGACSRCRATDQIRR
jgi:ankyrin repeat protein